MSERNFAEGEIGLPNRRDPASCRRLVRVWGGGCVGGPERRRGGWMGEGGGQELRASRAGLTSSNGDFISP